MMLSTPISTCSKSVVCIISNIRRQEIIRVSNAVRQSSCHYSTSGLHEPNNRSPINGFQVFQSNRTANGHSPSCRSLTLKRLLRSGQRLNAHVTVSTTGNQNLDLRFSANQSRFSEIKCNVGPFSLNKRSLLPAGVCIGLVVCFSTSEPSYAEAREGNEKKEGYCDASPGDYLHNKKILTDFSVIGIPGDGRCLFRSVAHGACIRSGKPAPNDSFQRDLADELRDRVADEFIKRREETEWFIEGDFETYVSQMRKPHVWGGEPELLMASHVLQMPITVYMHDQDSSGLISIAEYGQEYGKDNPVKVLYHGYGHYDALQVPRNGGPKSRL